MAWIARNAMAFTGKTLCLFKEKPIRSENSNNWIIGTPNNYYCALPLDADEKLIGRHLTWEDEPVEI